MAGRKRVEGAISVGVMRLLNTQWCRMALKTRTWSSLSISLQSACD
jgi:hypothetical protein